MQEGEAYVRLASLACMLNSLHKLFFDPSSVKAESQPHPYLSSSYFLLIFFSFQFEESASPVLKGREPN